MGKKDAWYLKGKTRQKRESGCMSCSGSGGFMSFNGSGGRVRAGREGVHAI